jgi:hypothetical protein
MARKNKEFSEVKRSPGRPKGSGKKRDIELVGVDCDPTLYELTDLFYSYYQYHNEQCMLDYDAVITVNPSRREVRHTTKSMPRFPSFRRIEALRLGSRPFVSGEGIAAHKPNTSFSYFNLFTSYLVLPYKAIFTDSRFVKIQTNKALYDKTKTSEREQEVQRLEEANNPNSADNARISDSLSDAFSNILRDSKKFKKCKEQLPRRVVQDAVGITLHSDFEWASEPLSAIDLVTEPQCSWEPDSWNVFFVIKKMSSQEAVKHIQEKTPFWNVQALRWALETAVDKTGILDRKHYSGLSFENENMCGENFMVRSFYSEKSARRTNISAYYGNMFVVEAYYHNKKGGIDKTIFYPSSLFAGVSAQIRQDREQYEKNGGSDKDNELLEKMHGADVLFHRSDVFDKMSDAITVIPADRAEPTLERQRFYGHLLFSPIESLMRIDTSIQNLSMLMGSPFYKNRAQGTDAQDLQDLEIAVNGDIQDLGDREFAEIPFSLDLNALISVRASLLQHIASLCFLGGLDGQEMNANGRGAQLANLRLVRDGRVHKHNVEDFAEGLQESLSVSFRRVLDLIRKKDLISDTLLLRKFYDQLVTVEGYPKEFFQYKKKDLIEDTGLPYWLTLNVIRNGASHFGAAEVFLLSEIMNVYGSGLDQKALQKLTRTAIRGMLGPEDALDILGDPKTQGSVDEEQIYRARMENGSILGSVDQGALNYEPVIILPDKDDHVTHLAQAHLPKMQEIIQILQEGEVTPDNLQDLSEDQLNTRTNLILKLAALSAHVQLHTDMLDRFGARRDDVNQLKEQANFLLQAAEGLLNSLQINLRALNQKRTEKEMRLQGMSPENQIEKDRLELELLEIQSKRASDKERLMLANKIADQKQTQHLDKQVSKARDRELKRQIALSDKQLRIEDVNLRKQEVAIQGVEAANVFERGV